MNALNFFLFPLLAALGCGIGITLPSLLYVFLRVKLNQKFWQAEKI
jgi:hypothetical protein